MSGSGATPAGYFPMAFKLEGRRCLVVGGGKVGLRKTRGLLDYGGTVTVVSPVCRDELHVLAREGTIELLERAYRSGEAAQYGLVIAASDDHAVNLEVYDDCQQAHVPVNVVDDPAHCDFILSSTVRRGPLTISIGTQGAAPFMSRWVREWLEDRVPAYWSDLAQLAAAMRRRVLAIEGLSFAEKAAYFKRFLETDWEAILAREAQRSGGALDERQPARKPSSTTSGELPETNAGTAELFDALLDPLFDERSDDGGQQ